MHADMVQHYSRIRNILVWVLFLNWAVAAVKIIYGLTSRCVSMTADGFHSLSDGTSNVICLVGIRFACQPKDRDHPYGHKKYETLFSLVIAGLLFIVSFNLFKEGVSRIHKPGAPSVDITSFAVMLITLAVNIWVMRYEHRKGMLLHSDILISDAMHTKADVFTSLSVIATLIVVKLGYPLADPIVTMVIALFIAYMGFEIAKQSSDVLCDTAPIADVQKISHVVLEVKGVKACHKIRTRGRPDDINVDLHVQVSPQMHIDEAHKISYAIEEAIVRNIPNVTDVVVHMEPKERTRHKD
jgi:cation diffusion facilitator family transporter